MQGFTSRAIAMGLLLVAAGMTGCARQEEGEKKPAAKQGEPAGAATTQSAARALVLDCGGGVVMNLVPIPAGTFVMGSKDGNAGERPPHPVTISHLFYRGRFGVTQAQRQAVMGK